MRKEWLGGPEAGRRPQGGDTVKNRFAPSCGVLQPGPPGTHRTPGLGERIPSRGNLRPLKQYILLSKLKRPESILSNKFQSQGSIYRLHTHNYVPSSIKEFPIFKCYHHFTTYRIHGIVASLYDWHVVGVIGKVPCHDAYKQLNSKYHKVISL